jgi:hypothetical protein
LVALGWVEGELAEELSGGGVDDPDVAVLDQDDDSGSGVGSADAHGGEPAAVTQGDLAEPAPSRDARRLTKFRSAVFGDEISNLELTEPPGTDLHGRTDATGVHAKDVHPTV